MFIFPNHFSRVGLPKAESTGRTSSEARSEEGGGLGLLVWQQIVSIMEILTKTGVSVDMFVLGKL
jgi:hypothetical protein